MGYEFTERVYKNQAQNSMISKKIIADKKYFLISQKILLCIYVYSSQPLLKIENKASDNLEPPSIQTNKL